MHSTSGAHTSVILKWTRELDSLRLLHSSSRDDSNCLAMLPELAKLKITTVHCKHLSVQLVTGDGREYAVVRPGYELSVTISYIRTLVYIQPMSSFTAEGHVNSYADIVGGPPDDDDDQPSYHGLRWMVNNK